MDWPYLLLGAAVLLLTCYRAATTGVTYDEAETYLRYVAKSSRPDPDALAGFLSVNRANNHPLNTVLIDISSALFPYNELAIRLPNLLAFVAYLLLAVTFSRGFKGRPLLFALLTLNYTLDEFFGLARGYSLSAALVFVALVVHTRAGGEERGLRLSLWLLLLASLANYAAVAALAAVGVEALLARGPRFVLRALRAWSSLVGGLVLSWILYAFSAVSEEGKPLIGDEARRFWEPVVGGYVRMFVPEAALSQPILVSIGILLVALLAPEWTGRTRRFHAGRCLVILLALVTLASHGLGKPMPIGRVLLPFWPLAALAIGEALDFHLQWSARRRPSLAVLLRVACWLGLAGLCWAFARQADPNATREWRDNYAIARSVKERLARGDCIERDLTRHPVAKFYIKRAGRQSSDPALACR